MPKPKSGFKRSRHYEPPSGVEIECSEATYKRLRNAALVNRCTIGQFVETVLINNLYIQFIAPVPSDLPPPPTGKKRQFAISERLFADIERFTGSEAKARRFIAGNLLYALRREEVRQAGERAEQSWRERYRI
jgi:hypothetical protein